MEKETLLRKRTSSAILYLPTRYPGPLIAAFILIARKREERGIRRFLARA